jgi:uncharacterized membrane protein
MSKDRLRGLSIGLTFVMIAIVIAWQLSDGITASRLVWCIVFTLPLFAPLRGFLRRDRRTYAWATLCVIPYFILGVTESVASPERRIWAGLCLAAALALFTALILYLRVTNPQRAASEHVK